MSVQGHVLGVQQSLCVHVCVCVCVRSSELQGDLGDCPATWHKFATKTPSTPHVSPHESSSPATLICITLYFRIFGIWLMLKHTCVMFVSAEQISFRFFFAVTEQIHKRKQITVLQL